MSDRPLILIVEDERPIIRFLRASLTTQGFRLEVAETGREGLSQVHTLPPDLIILDLGLPDMDGMEVIRQVRQWSQVPIIVLSARDRERDKVEALDLGADDYLAKPFGVGELSARVRVALRHQARRIQGREDVRSWFESGDLKVDFERRRVTVLEEEVHLTPIEFRLLSAMVEHAGKVLTHRMLLKEVWGQSQSDEGIHQVRVHVANLRRKIEGNPAQPRHILTEQGVGYRFAEEDAGDADASRGDPNEPKDATR